MRISKLDIRDVGYFSVFVHYPVLFVNCYLINCHQYKKKNIYISMYYRHLR